MSPNKLPHQAPRVVLLLLVILLLLRASHVGTGSSSKPTIWHSSTSNESSLPKYPEGDCVTQCSADPAQRLAHCSADPAAGIPATTCTSQSVDADTCPSLRYPDAL